MYAKKYMHHQLVKYIYFFTIKNILFLNTENDAESSLMVFSIIQTSIADELSLPKARECLEKLITEISDNPKKEDLKKFFDMEY